MADARSRAPAKLIVPIKTSDKLSRWLIHSREITDAAVGLFINQIGKIKFLHGAGCTPEAASVQVRKVKDRKSLLSTLGPVPTVVLYPGIVCNIAKSVREKCANFIRRTCEFYWGMWVVGRPTFFVVFKKKLIHIMMVSWACILFFWLNQRREMRFSWTHYFHNRMKNKIARRKPRHTCPFSASLQFCGRSPLSLHARNVSFCMRRAGGVQIIKKNKIKRKTTYLCMHSHRP